jgi:DNA-binding NtrC family response regulator
MKKRPDLKALYMSGYAGGNILLAKGINQAATYLQKPFSLQTLASHVRQALDKSS